MKERTTVSRREAAYLLNAAFEDLRAGKAVDGIERAYLLEVVAALAQACESDDPRRFENIAGRVLRIQRGRQPAEIGEGRFNRDGASLAVDALTVVMKVEGLRRAGFKTPEVFQIAADKLGTTDVDRIRKTYYAHWDGETYYPAPRK